MDPLRNKLDPLRKSGPDQQLELFRKLAGVCAGFSTEDVVGAALNVLVNALRQAHSSRRDAEASWNDHFGKSKQTLLSHYDSVTGRRLNVFPHRQVVEMSHFTDKDRSNR